MKIEQIALPAYGPFTRLRLDLTPQGKLHLVYGYNEAGKSSLLRGIRAALFDFPVQCPDDFLHPYNDLRVGAVLVDSDGTSLDFTRRKGTKNTIQTVDGRLVSDAEFARFLGGMQPSFFQALFGLDHRMLQEGGKHIVNGEGEVAKLLFEAGGLPQLSETLAALERTAKDIFGAPNSQKPLNVKLREIQKLRGDIREATLRPDDYIDRKKELDQKTSRIREIRQRRQNIALRLQDLERIKSNKSDLVEYANLLAGIANLRDLPELPSDFAKRRVEAQQSLRTASGRIEKVENRLVLQRRNLGSFPSDFPLLEYAMRISALLAGTGNFRTQVTDRRKLADRSRSDKQTARAKWHELMPSRSFDDLEAFIWPASQIAEFQALCDEFIELEVELRRAEEALDIAREDAQQLQSDIDGLPADIQTEQLDAILATVEAQAHERRERELEKEYEEAISKRDRDFKKISWWQGAADEIEDVVAPPFETITRYESDLSALEEERRSLLKKQEENAAEQLVQKNKLRALSSQGEVPTEERLLSEREKRDCGWSLIRRSAFQNEFSLTHAESQYEPPVPLDEAFERHLRGADDVADKLRIDSKRAADFALCTEKLQLLENAERQLAEKLEGISAERDQLISEWKAEWRGLTFEVRPPAEMRPWELSRRAFADLTQQAQGREKELQRQRGLIVSCRSRIGNELAHLGQPGASDSEPLSAIASRSKRFSEMCKTNREEAKSKREELRRLNIRIPKLAKKGTEQKEKLDAWKTRWDTALIKAAIPDVSMPQIKASLTAMPTIRDAWNSHRDAERRMKGLDTHIADYKGQVGEIVMEVAPELKDLSPDLAVDELDRRSKQQQGKANQKQKCSEHIEALEEELAIHQGETELARKELKELCDIAGCGSDVELSGVEDKVRDFRELDKARNQLEVVLIKRNEGKTLDSIREEATGYDNEALSLEQVSLKDEDEQADTELQQTYREIAKLDATLSSDEANTRHLELTQDLQVRLSEVRTLAVQYARTSIQQFLLQQAAEKFRTGHEAPVLKRASDIFSALTLGNFSGLTTDYSDNGKVLKAVRANSGKQLQMSGLSDGTADQLFLALRLAAVEDYSKTHQAFPCVFDDILVNNDDPRTAATLAVLADFSEQHQVLLFTHHRHVLELADREIEGRFVTHELNPVAAAASGD